jgi:CHAT domain-containing protein
LLAEFESLGFEFYRIGARPFIGTLAPVPERHANKLASRYYHWLIDQRMTAIQALRNAKADVAADGGIPFWLFYCYYGTADQAPYRLH